MRPLNLCVMTCLAGVVALSLVTVALGQDAAADQALAQFKQGSEQYQALDFKKAKETLLKVDKTKLTKADAGQLDNYLATIDTDIKEQAEHIMLVDLGRNDIGRIAEPGSVEVTQFMDVERYSHVMHLVSHVQGKLRSDLTPFDALRACFPAGTVSGAPKIRAMEIIAELEPDKRGPYAGAVGYFSFSGNLDTAITIRTIVMKDGTAHVQAGAGIVYDSVPEREHQECMNKAKALMKAIEAAEEAYATADR